MEVRAIPGIRPRALLDPVLGLLPSLEAQGYRISTELLSEYPGLSLDADSPLVALVERASGARSQDAVSYGTEAGLYEAAGIPSIICGPGDIARAHKADEFIRLSELDDCVHMIRNLLLRLSGGIA